MAAQMCQQGQPEACQAAQWFGQMGMGLANAYQACRQGRADACQAYAREAPRARAALGQFQAQFGAGQGDPGRPVEEPGLEEPGYDE